MAAQSDTIRLGTAQEPVRLSYPNLHIPQANQSGKLKYTATYLLDPSIKSHGKAIRWIEKEAERLAKEEWPKLKSTANVKMCFGDGNDERAATTGEIRSGYENMWFIKASNAANKNDGTPLPKPTIIGRDAKPLDIDSGKPYGGCFVFPSISLWANYHPEGGHRILANIRVVQFIKDGEAFGVEAVNAESEGFEALEELVEEFDEDDDDIPF